MLVVEVVLVVLVVLVVEVTVMEERLVGEVCIALVSLYHEKINI